MRDVLTNCIAQKQHVYFIGIKGTGMCALAELLLSEGVRISGSDTACVFYTDAILKSCGIPYREEFSAANVPDDAALVIHSAAYDESNPEIAEARRRAVPTLVYTDALGEYSSNFISAGISGVHGKTTTTALSGAVARALNLPARVLAGSAVGAFGGRCTLNLGSEYFIAETCEYRRHFLAFHPKYIVLSSVEPDHQDYYPDYESIRAAFCEYAAKLPEDGALIYCADDKGAAEVAATREGVTKIEYGFSAKGAWRVESARCENERLYFKIARFEKEFSLSVPGRHNVSNAAAALALNYILFNRSNKGGDDEFFRRASEALAGFKGSKRRSEILGERGGILFMDDYGHHPSAIKTTLRGLKEFYPGRTLVVSFMSHTYSRTAALLDDFARAFEDADMLILHKIYPSAREKETFGIDGKTLFERTKKYHNNVIYVDEPSDAVSVPLPPGPLLFLTLGAGDNRKLGEKLYNGGGL